MMLICGVDEAGRGPLAGPVFAAAVVLGAGADDIEGIADSKRLSAARRDALARLIKAQAQTWASDRRRSAVGQQPTMRCKMAKKCKGGKGKGR